MSDLSEEWIKKELEKMENAEPTGITEEKLKMAYDPYLIEYFNKARGRDE